ncbi:P1 family peptidase [Ahrensia sp. R2A130]|uniref:P1 family peptidase n=1 Tax=Ahrensia sp. R2A130 TaxID=744979 RepID=UPI00058D2D33|nr:P1 family peptidase [Ahrensia sp. R2A130]
MTWQAGPRNSITDIAGLRVGNAHDDSLKSGVTALLCDLPNVASVHVMGGAPGTRETDLLSPENTVESVDALVLSGGSAFGLDAAGGVQQVLRDAGRGFAVGPHRVPIVPSAILFDLINGGDKDWGDQPPYRDLGIRAAQAASENFATGSAGAGFGALTGGPNPGLKGGLGTASTMLENGVIVAALVAVNALGSPVCGDSGQFRASDFELNDEFGGYRANSEDPSALHIKFGNREQEAGANTTIGIIATNAKLSKGAAKRLAVAAHDGFAHALWPSHTPLDGDLVFSISTGAVDADGDLPISIELSAAAAATMARAITRGVHDATTMPNDLFPTWADRFHRT